MFLVILLFHAQRKRAKLSQLLPPRRFQSMLQLQNCCRTRERSPINQQQNFLRNKFFTWFANNNLQWAKSIASDKTPPKKQCKIGLQDLVIAQPESLWRSSLKYDRILTSFLFHQSLDSGLVLVKILRMYFVQSNLKSVNILKTLWDIKFQISDCLVNWFVFIFIKLLWLLSKIPLKPSVKILQVGIKRQNYILAKTTYPECKERTCSIIPRKKEFAQVWDHCRRILGRSLVADLSRNAWVC